MADPVRTEVVDGVLVVTLDRPTANAIDVATSLALYDAFARLESDADRVMRSALSKLFREESDLKQVMKLRVIYDLLESVTDRCEDVANVVEGIVLENS